MLKRKELKEIIEARMQDAEILFLANRYDGAIYLCGYAVEIALKLRICQTLRWAGFPSSNKEFQNFLTLKTHSLDVLLALSGLERKIKKKFLKEWSEVAKWSPETRYNPVGTATDAQTKRMIDYAKILLKEL